MLRGRPEAAVYADRSLASRHLIPGLSDIDLVAVTPDDPAGAHAEHLRMRRRWARLERLMPPGARRLVSDGGVYEESELRAAAGSSLLTYGLEPSSANRLSAAMFGVDTTLDDVQLRFRPGLASPTAGWRLISGRDRRPPAPPPNRQRLRIAAWLELQFWWRTAFEAIATPASPWAPYACVKMVSEPARILLTLAGEHPPASREETLCLAASRLPGMGGPCKEALELLRALHRSPEPPLSRFLRHLISLSEAISARLGEEVAPEGATEVSLLGGNAEPLALPGVHGSQRGLLPLLDWRGLVVPSLPDEALRPPPGEGIAPDSLIAALRAPQRAVYPAFRSSGLLVLPVSDSWRRGILRAAEAPLTDPVSFALTGGRRTAAFPDVSGWSARDWARRSIAEHAAWLARPLAQQLGEPTAREWLDGEASRAGPSTRVLAKLLTSARAALFYASVEAGKPALPLTVAATGRLLSEQSGGDGGPEAAVESYLAARAGASPEPPVELLEPLRKAVLGLPAYAGVASAS